ncbi:hypothetical protein CC80DRAFT_404396, partial [Byssothecium circinans]
FNFNALYYRVVALYPSASSITLYNKKEGSFNRVFIFYTNNRKYVIIRLLFLLAGLARLIINSKVITIKFYRFYTKVISKK